MERSNVSIVIPVFKPDKEVFSRVKKAIERQTLKVEVIEIEHSKEAVAMNTGIRKAAGNIIVILKQDCIPENEYWLENLVKPFEDKEIIATVSDTVSIPRELWNKFGVFTKAITAKEQRLVRSLMDTKGCAYRKSILEKVEMFNEDPQVLEIDYDLYQKIKDYGKIVYPGCKIIHYHKFTLNKRLKLEYEFAKSAGKVAKVYGPRENYFWKAILKSIPVLGIAPIIYVYPIKRKPFLFLPYLAFLPFLHLLYLHGFWKGYFGYKQVYIIKRKELVERKREIEEIGKRKILVTGGLGHIGSKLIRELAKQKDIGTIRILDNISTQRYPSLFHLPTNKKYQFIDGDIRDEKILEKSMKNIDLVIHLAAITDAPSTINMPELTYEVNLNGTKKILGIAKKSGVKSFIFPSTTSVYGEAEGVVDENYKNYKPSSPYAESKLAAEKEVIKANTEGGMMTFVLRFGTIFGSSIGMRFHTAVNKFVYLACMNKPLTVWKNALDQKRPYLGLNDAIRVFLFIENNGKPGQIYNVLTNNYTVREVIDTIKYYIPNLKIEMTSSPILNQKSYFVSNKKFTDLGFEFNDNLEDYIKENIELFKAIKNPN